MAKYTRFEDLPVWQEAAVLYCSCSKQIGAWVMSIERSPIKGKRHLTSQTYRQREPEIENGRNGIRRRPGNVRRSTKMKGQ
jgi:hypothetical protein